MYMIDFESFYGHLTKSVVVTNNIDRLTVTAASK